MKCGLSVLCAALAASAFALPRVKISDVLAMDADEIAACGKCELEVQVTFNIPWVENAFVATDVGDVDGHALYFATFTEPQPGKFDMVEPGDIVRVVGAPDPMLLEPGIDVESVKFVSHADLPPPRPRSVLGIKAGHFNNCRVHVRGVGMSAAYGTAVGKPAFLLWLSTSDGEVRVRVRADGLSPAAFRDADVEVDGVVVPVFNPRHEFIGAEIEALDAKSISVAKAPPEDPFSVPECDTWSLLAWSPRGRRLHACRVMGEVTCVYTEDGAFSVQRGKASARVFADGEPPAVGDIVEAVGFPAIRDECGALVGALWRRTDAEVEPAEVHRLSLAPGSLFDLGGFMADNDLQFRLVELVGRVEDVRLEHGPGGRLIIDVDGQNVDVMLPPSVAAELPWGIEDRPIVRVRGVLDARVSQGDALNRLFSFEGFHLRTRCADDIELGPAYRDVVARLRAAREVEPMRFGLKDLAPGRVADQRFPDLAPGRAARSPLSYLVAASLIAALALAALYVAPRGGGAADVPLTVYTVAYAPTEEALELIVASQRADGSWSNDFLTRQNAAALRASDDERMRVAYRRAVRYLRTKGLSPLTDAELKARGEYAARSRLGA